MSGNPYEGWDFCEDCMKKIVTVIDGTELEARQAAPEEPEEQEAVEGGNDDQDPEEEEDEDAEDPEEESKVIARLEGYPKQKTVNLRELRELVKQGKTAKEIAGHFGISVASYYNYRKKAESLYNAGML